MTEWILWGIAAALSVAALTAVLWSVSVKGRDRKGAMTPFYQWAFAHRGLHGAGRPENSLAAFSAAVERGYGAELDVHLTADGEPAVLHDSSLRRTAGVDRRVEDMTSDELAQVRLEGTEDTVPLLCQVLALFEGKAPLIIELKAVRGNHAALCERVCRELEGYNGDYMLESFDPRCLMWLKKHRPQLLRGQLSQNFWKDKTAPFGVRGVLTSLVTNALSKPDFAAYRYEHRRSMPLRIWQRVWRLPTVYWTIRCAADHENALKEGAISIFEGFEP